MYELVKTDEQQTIFNSIWEEAWKEKGYELEYSDNPLAQVLLRQQGEYAASIEFKRISDSDIQQAFDFQSIPSLAAEYDRIVEIDKLAVHKKYRSINLMKQLIFCIEHFAIERSISTYVGLMEPRLFAVLRRYWKRDIIRLGPTFYYKGDDVVPTSVDMNCLFTDTEIPVLQNQ